MKRWIPARLSATQLRVPRPSRRAAGYAAVAAACLAGAAIAVPAARAAAPPASGCAAVNLIVARASTEAAGEGTTQSLATQIVNSSTQTVSQEAVVYPATLTNYASSESQGVTNAEQELTTAVNNCPNQKQVLLGYSQGAQVSMDVIAGNAEVGSVKAVSTAISSHVVAIANFGDPGHVVNQSWDLGTATRAGLFPRSSAQLKLLTTFGGSGKIAAWCDANDPYCASGANLQVHLTYLNRYQNAAASFVLGKIGG